MSLSVSEFLTGKGAVELLCEVDPNGSRFKNLEDEVPVSKQTLTNRLGEGVEASLLEREFITAERGTSHVYALTPKGATFRRVLEESATVITYRQFKEVQNQLEEKKAEMREWARTELPKFDDEDHERHLSQLQGDKTFHIPEGGFGYIDISDNDSKDSE